MDFQVRKGLETPLKVHGMRTKFFCIYCIILAVIVLFVVGFLTSAMSGEGSFLAFIVSLVAGAFASVVLRIVFINLSMQRKFGTVQRGTRWYASMRAFTIRRLRLPKPQVRRGERPE